MLLCWQSNAVFLPNFTRRLPVDGDTIDRDQVFASTAECDPIELATAPRTSSSSVLQSDSLPA
jgi:hypothetical protein